MAMTEKQKELLKKIADQLYAINARNISLPWIGLRKTPTSEEISNLNQMLGFIIKEMRTLAESGDLDIDKLHKEYFKV